MIPGCFSKAVHSVPSHINFYKSFKESPYTNRYPISFISTFEETYNSLEKQPRIPAEPSSANNPADEGRCAACGAA